MSNNNKGKAGKIDTKEGQRCKILRNIPE